MSSSRSRASGSFPLPLLSFTTRLPPASNPLLSFVSCRRSCCRINLSENKQSFSSFLSPRFQASIYNPLLVLLALFCFPLASISDQEQSSIIARMGGIIGDWLSPPSPLPSPFPSWGMMFQTIVAVNALLVLSGSVLTAYVGIGGLISRWREGKGW